MPIVSLFFVLFVLIFILFVLKIFVVFRADSIVIFRVIRALISLTFVLFVQTCYYRSKLGLARRTKRRCSPKLSK